MFTTWKHFSQWAAIAAATILLFSGEAQAQKPPKPSDGSKLSFTTYDLNPGGPYGRSEARGLNDSGTAVGYAGGPTYPTDWTRAMCWRLSNGTVISQALDEGDALPDTTTATAVNSGGAIAGMGEYVVEVPDPEQESGSSYWPLYQGMYWSSEDAEPIRLDTPVGYHACLPTAINEDGVIVGVAYQLAAGPEFLCIVGVTAVAWRVVDGEVSDVTTLGPLDIDDGSTAYGVNNVVGEDKKCLVAGNSRFLLRDNDGSVWDAHLQYVGTESNGTAVTWAVTLEDDGTLGVSDPEEIVTPGDGRYSLAYGINDLDKACGVATRSDGYHGYLGYAGAQPLGTLKDTYFPRYSVRDVNLAGEAVGYLEQLLRRPGMPARYAVIWVGGSPTKLESVMGKSTFSSLRYANQINTRGDIVGYGSTNSGSHAFLMIRK